MGGTQALSRSTYSKLIPKTDNTFLFLFLSNVYDYQCCFGNFHVRHVELTGSIRTQL